MIMSVASAVVGLYGIFSLVGGVIGYLKVKSRASLAAGSASGIVLLVCAAGLRDGNRNAAIGSLLVALALGGRFAGTWRRNHRIMPDLLMVLLSFATPVTVGLGLLTQR